MHLVLGGFRTLTLALAGQSSTLSLKLLQKGSLSFRLVFVIKVGPHYA